MIASIPGILSKAEYLRGVQCPKALWLYRHRRRMMSEASPRQKIYSEQGCEAVQLARKRFPGGVLIAEDDGNIPEALKATQAAIQSGARVLFEPAALFNGLLVRANVLIRTDAGEWDLIEAKASMGNDKSFLYDIASQRHVLHGASFPIRQAYLLNIASSYVRRGDIDAHKFFTLKNVTEATGDEFMLRQGIKRQIREMQDIVASEEMPEAEVGERCNYPSECGFKSSCWKAVPAGSTHELTRFPILERSFLKSHGVTLMRDIPDDFDLTPSQRIQVKVAKTGEPHIDREAIGESLQGLKYPLYFLDFETISLPIPPYDGLRPFEFLTFQASIRIQEQDGWPTSHFEYLGDGKSDPRLGLVNFLRKHIGPEGSVIVDNKLFKRDCLQSLAVEFSAKYNFLLSVTERLWDIGEPFRGTFYVHPAFGGSWSLKTVLPALVPEMTYGNLVVQDGPQAQFAYWTLMREARLPDQERQKIMDGLRQHCGQDALGMVALLKHLRSL